MKIAYFGTAILCLALMVSNCTSTSEQHTLTSISVLEKLKESGLATTVPLKEAKQQIADYSSFVKNLPRDSVYLPPLFPISFLMPIADIAPWSKDTTLMVRAYMALDAKDRDTTRRHLHLLVVPTQRVTNVYYQDTIPLDTVGPVVYDLIAPCPKTCDPISQLYQAGTWELDSLSNL